MDPVEAYACHVVGMMPLVKPQDHTHSCYKDWSKNSVIEKPWALVGYFSW